MQPKTPKHIEDIRASCVLILGATNGRTFEDYRQEPILRAAVERHFEIIGEAMNRIARSDPQTAERIDNKRQIIAFRNLLIHGYDVIDDLQVWTIVQENLPALARQVLTLIEESR